MMTHSTATLHTRAILVKVSLPTWGGKAGNKEAADQVLDSHGASRDAGTFTSKLIPPSASTQRQRDAGEEQNAFHALCSHMAAVRKWSYANTLPWDTGRLLLPIANHAKYTTFMREAQHKFEELRRILHLDWDELVIHSKRLLNGSAPKNAKWPRNIIERFKFTIEFEPVPSGGDFRVELTAEEIAILSASTEQRVKDAAEAATLDATQRLYKVLANIHDTLSEKNPNMKDGMKGFKDTLIGNARAVCDTLKRLNVNDDARLEQFRRQTELLAAHEPETLRTLPALRAETADRAQSILDDMTKTFGKGIFG